MQFKADAGKSQLSVKHHIIAVMLPNIESRNVFHWE